MLRKNIKYFIPLLLVLELWAQSYTVTTNYGLRKPDPHSAGWGDLINLNFDDLDSLLSGGRLLVNLKTQIMSIGNYNIVPTTPTISRTLTIADPGRDARFATTFNNSGGMYQTRSGTGCATAATQFATCDLTITWFSGFSDTSYKSFCSGEGVTSGVPTIAGINIASTKTTTTISVRTIALTAAAAQFTFINCTGIHD